MAGVHGSPVLASPGERSSVGDRHLGGDRRFADVDRPGSVRESNDVNSPFLNCGRSERPAGLYPRVVKVLFQDHFAARPSSKLDWRVRHPPLPLLLSGKLQAYSDAAVSKVVPKLRNAARQFRLAEGRAERMDMLSEYLTWDDLIHTSYFHHPHFRKLLAFAPTRAEGFQATPAFKLDPVHDLIASWYSQIVRDAAVAKPA